VIACPECDHIAHCGKKACRCRHCGLVFPMHMGIVRDKYRKRGPSKPVIEKKEKYHGAPAARITVPQFRWGGTRLG
jgi:hypothetical protein